MPKYTYLACDLLTNQVLAELPLTGVDFSLALGGFGHFNGALALGDPEIAKLDPLNSTQPSRTALYVDRDGALIWGGIIWTRVYDSSQEQLQLAGSEFFSYFTRRRIVDDKIYVGQDPAFIFRDLINYAQAKPGGNIGIAVGAELTGRTMDRTFHFYEYRPVAEACQVISQADPTFDFAVDVFYDSSHNPAKALHLGIPRRGSIQGKTGWVFEYPGNIVGFRFPEDGTNQTVTNYAIGLGEGDSMLRSSSSETSLLDAGYPLLEGVSTYKDQGVQATLDAHARADARALRSPVTLPEFDVRADMDPVLGSYVTGDDALMVVADGKRFPATAPLRGYYRIITINIRPPADNQPETVHFTTQPAS